MAWSWSWIGKLAGERFWAALDSDAVHCQNCGRPTPFDPAGGEDISLIQ